MRRWTEEEEDLLRDLYPTADNLTLSERLGRNISSIENKASRMGLRKEKKEAEAEEGGGEDFENRFELISREEAIKLDKVDLLRINWSLVLMYQSELNNPNLTKGERHKLMNALSNHTAIINNIMKSAEEELREEDDLEEKFIEIVSGDEAARGRARRLTIDIR